MYTVYTIPFPAKQHTFPSDSSSASPMHLLQPGQRMWPWGSTEKGIEAGNVVASTLHPAEHLWKVFFFFVLDTAK